MNKREEELNSMIQEKCEGFQTEKDVLEAEMETLEVHDSAICAHHRLNTVWTSHWFLLFRKKCWILRKG